MSQPAAGEHNAEKHQQAAPSDDLHAALAASRAETRAAFENRALIYYYVFDELSDVVGPEQAAEIMKRAIYRRGLDVGAKYRAAGEAGHLDEVGRLFCGGSPCQGTLFEPGVEASEGDEIVLRMTACPLVDAWREIGLEADQIDLLCEIAAAVDEGTFAAAGLELDFEDRLGRSDASSCLLRLRVPS
jgi:hypothetical protein